MAGYIRQDTTNNIADGNVINASDFDNEYNAIEAAFHATTGHTHDGTSAEGAPITKIGPTQDVVASATALTPKTDNTVDLGSSTLEYKDLYIDGTANIDSLVADTADINAGTIDGVTIGGASAGAGTFTTVAATTGNITTVNATTVDTTNIEVTNVKAKDGTSAATIADSTGVVSFTANPVMSGGTANGVTYLNASKVLTSGSALTFDGNKFTVSRSTNGTSARIENINANQYGVLEIAGSSRGGEIDFLNGSTVLSSIYSSTANDLVFTLGTGFTEQMRLTSTGLGIGTSSPSRKLEVNGIFRQTDGTVQAEIASGGGVAYYGTNNNYPVAIQVNAVERARFDTSGNLGLGVTPSAWDSGFQVLENSGGSFSSGSNAAIRLLQNAYFATSYKYKFSSTPAGRYELASGQHQWFTAPSGTAGNAISFTQAMTLDASGNLEIGGTFALGRRLNVYSASNGYSMSLLQTSAFNSGNLAGTAYAGYYDGSSITDMASIRGGKENTTSGNFAGMLAFYTRRNGGSDTERARITSGGDLLVGTTDSTGGIAGTTPRFVVEPPNTSSHGVILKSLGQSYDVGLIWNTAASGDNKFFEFGTDATYTARGSIDYNRAGGLVRYNTTSDYRAKDILGPVANPGATIDALKVYEGRMKGATQARPMLVAHEAQEHAPYAVSGVKDQVNDDGTPKFQQMDVSSLVPLLIAEIQSLRARVAALEA